MPLAGSASAMIRDFMSQRFAQIVAEVAAAAGIPVRIADRITPTPALSYAVKHLARPAG